MSAAEKSTALAREFSAEMEELMKKLDELLRQNFPGAETELEQVPPLPKVGGFLIWPGFEAQEQLDRQHSVWRVLRQGLSREEQRQITAILTLTPDEIAVMREG